MDKKSANKAWKALEKQYARSSLSHKSRLRRQFHSVAPEAGGNILEHINQLKTLRDELRQMGEEISDRDLAMTLMGLCLWRNIKV